MRHNHIHFPSFRIQIIGVVVGDQPIFHTAEGVGALAGVHPSIGTAHLLWTQNARRMSDPVGHL